MPKNCRVSQGDPPHPVALLRARHGVESAGVVNLVDEAGKNAGARLDRPNRGTRAIQVHTRVPPIYAAAGSQKLRRYHSFTPYAHGLRQLGARLARHREFVAHSPHSSGITPTGGSCRSGKIILANLCASFGARIPMRIAYQLRNHASVLSNAGAPL